MRTALPVTMLVLISCATPMRPVERGEWVVLPPNPEDDRRVLAAEEYWGQVQRGERRRVRGSLERRPPDLLDATSPVRLPVGEVASFTLVDVPVSALRRSGDAAEIFWTRPYEVRRRGPDGRFVGLEGSDVYVEALRPGRTVLQVIFEDGTRREIAFVVPADTA